MSDRQAMADRVEIEALRGEYTDALMLRDYGRLASLFTEDAVVRIPDIHAEAKSRQEIRAGVERLQELWDYFVQTHCIRLGKTGILTSRIGFNGVDRHTACLEFGGTARDEHDLDSLVG